MGYHNSFNAVQYVFPLGIIGEYISALSFKVIPLAEWLFLFPYSNSD
jgi:hypothetical protein